MYNINITLTREQADALCTVLSVLENGSDLQKLYRAIQDQFPRSYTYRLIEGETRHQVYDVQRVALVKKSDS